MKLSGENLVIGSGLLAYLLALLYLDISKELLDVSAYTVIMFGSAVYAYSRESYFLGVAHWLALSFMFLFHVGLLYYLIWILGIHIPWWVYLIVAFPEMYAITYGIAIIPIRDSPEDLPPEVSSGKPLKSRDSKN